MSKNKYGGINDMESRWTKIPENKKVYMLWFDMLRRCYDDAQIKSEKEACEAMGVHKCSIASCYRRGYKCKGYEISQLENERNTKE